MFSLDLIRIVIHGIWCGKLEKIWLKVRSHCARFAGWRFKPPRMGYKEINRSVHTVRGQLAGGTARMGTVPVLPQTAGGFTANATCWHQRNPVVALTARERLGILNGRQAKSFKFKCKNINPRFWTTWFPAVWISWIWELRLSLRVCLGTWVWTMIR